MHTTARHLWAFGACVALAVVLSWPLPMHLSTHLTAPPSSDGGVYVWNLWVFHHELIDGGRMPLYTSQVFPMSGVADLSLHNYTVASNVLALPILPRLGLVRTFNLVYLLQLALAGYGVFLLARFVTGRSLEAWLAGAMFMASPVLTARSLGHFSLVAAAPLAFFLLAALRYRQQPQVRMAVAAGAAAGWAAYSDPYYSVYCVLLAAVVFGDHLLGFPPASAPPGETRRRLLRVTDGLLVLAGATAVTLAIAHAEQVHIAGVHIHTRTLYTPMLVLTVLACARAVLASSRRVCLAPGERVRRVSAFLAVTAVVAAIVTSPVLFAVAKRIGSGRFVSPRDSLAKQPAGRRRARLRHAQPDAPMDRPFLAAMAARPEPGRGRRVHRRSLPGRPGGGAHGVVASP